MESFVLFFYFIVLALPITAISVIIIIIVERTIFCKYFRFLTLFSKALYKCEVWVLVKIQVTEVTFYCTLETRKSPFNHFLAPVLNHLLLVVCYRQKLDSTCQWLGTRSTSKSIIVCINN